MLFVGILSCLLGCSSDVSIIKRYDEAPQDTGESILDTNEPATEPANEPGEPSEEPSGEMSELTIGYGEIHFRQIACPPCVGAASEFDITATLKLHYPTSGDYTDYLQEPGTCTTNLIQTYVSSQPLASNQPAAFNGITLNPSGQGEWYNGFIYEYQYERNTSYSITTEHGIINNAFTSIEGFDDIQPYTLLWVDPSYAYDTVISKNGTTFTWYPSVPNSQFEIIVAVYSMDGSQFLGAVSCLENDVGSMFIPGSYFQMFPSYAIAAVHLIRHRIDRRPAPELNGYLQSHMIWEVIGTGHIE
ncbi:MAG TPA: hypothetical protein DF712_00710 [Balneola sp.]|nr:hypothetical protein [Balneola sp.]